MSSAASANTKLTKVFSDERRARTRTLIQAGGLLNLSGLFEICGIETGEDLQLDVNGMNKAATLAGILLETLQNIPPSPNPIQLEEWRRSGESFLKQTSANKQYGK